MISVEFINAIWLVLIVTYYLCAVLLWGTKDKVFIVIPIEGFLEEKCMFEDYLFE